MTVQTNSGWDADDHDVHLRDPRIVPGSNESALLGLLDLGAWNADDVAASSVEVLNFVRVDVESGEAEALFTKTEGQGDDRHSPCR
jgi:hypothetical protein